MFSLQKHVVGMLSYDTDMFTQQLLFIYLYAVSCIQRLVNGFDS